MYILYFFQFYLWLLYIVQSEENLIRISEGFVTGSEFLSRNGIKYYGYIGMPYAKPPLNDLRWKDPEKPNSWEGVRNCTEYRAMCPQFEYGVENIISGDEDCLYINVFSPKPDSTMNMPVLFYIPGGGFEMGEGKIYGPKYIMDKNVVLVTFNYRLGALGFLSFTDSELSGNYGMKDQVAALRWVQRNIKNFGGDPNKVTIGGYSAGSASVHWHLMSPVSKGLFHKAIMQSGTALAVWSRVTQEVARKRATVFSVLAGCEFKSTTETANCLRNIPFQDIVTIQAKFKIWIGFPFAFVIVEETTTLKNPFAIGNPWSLNTTSTVPLLIGYTADDGASNVAGLFRNNGTKLQILDKHYYRLLPSIWMYQYCYNLDSTRLRNVTDQIIAYYFGVNGINMNTYRNLIEFTTDAFTMYDTIETILKYEGMVYFYNYDHINQHSFLEFEMTNEKLDIAAVHCDDLISLFNTTYFPDELGTSDRHVSEQIVNLWTNFITTGNPSKGPSYIDGTQWLPTGNDFNNLSYFNIKENNSEMRQWNLFERYSFWKNLNLR